MLPRPLIKKLKNPMSERGDGRKNSQNDKGKV
jgi:hypothetical protein